MVNAMKPAPTITTWLPAPDLGDDAARLLERPEAVDAGAVGARDRRPHRGGPGRDQEVVVLEGGAVVERELPRPGVERRRPPPDVGRHAQPAELAGVAVKTCDSAMVRPR